MPVQRVQVNGKPAYRWGSTGKAYSYKAGDKASRNRARSMAERQGRAVEATRNRRTVGTQKHLKGK